MLCKIEATTLWSCLRYKASELVLRIVLNIFIKRSQKAGKNEARSGQQNWSISCWSSLPYVPSYLLPATQKLYWYAWYMQLNNAVNDCCIIGQYSLGKHCPTLPRPRQFASPNQPTSVANCDRSLILPHPKYNNAHSRYRRTNDSQWQDLQLIGHSCSSPLVASLIDQCYPLRPLFVPRPFKPFLPTTYWRASSYEAWALRLFGALRCFPFAHQSVM